MPLHEKELGRKVGISLIKEMRFLGKLKNDKNLDDLLDIPGRDQLSFQVIKGEDAAKSRNSKGNFGAELAGLRFCVADGEVERVNMMDIDHTIPFKYIHSKQELLLNYLNKPINADFVTGFLSASTIIDGREINISDYFRRNDSHQIQGTRRFFRLCYNDIDNLLLICHACNIEKGAKDSLEWFKKQEPFLGERFIEAVTKAGGLHDGIIVKKICKVSYEGNNVIKLGEFDCIAHDGEGKGLGEFINDWFENENPGYAEDLVEAYSGIWLELKDVYEQQLIKKAAGDKEKSEEAKNTARKVTSVLEASIDTVGKHYNIRDIVHSHDSSETPSRSSGDDSIDKRNRIIEIDEKIREMLNYMHGIKKIQSLISGNEPNLATNENKEELYRYYKELQISRMDPNTQKTFFRKIVDQLYSDYSLGKQHSVDDIKTIIRGFADDLSLRHRLEEAEARAAKLEELNKAKDERIAELEAAALPPEKRAKPGITLKPS